MLIVGASIQVPILLAVPTFDGTPMSEFAVADALNTRFLAKFLAAFIYMGARDYYHGAWSRSDCRSARAMSWRAVLVSLGCEAVMLFGTAWSAATD